MSVWKRLRRLLVVVHFKTLDDLKAYRNAIKEMGLNVHECSILAVVEDKKEKDMLGEISSVVYISEKEYNFLGKLKNEDASKLFSGKFDCIMYFGDFPKRIERSLSKIKPMITVGVNNNKYPRDIMLNSTSESPSHLLNFAKQTLEKIK